MCCAVGGFLGTTSPTADSNELPHGAYGRVVKTETILKLLKHHGYEVYDLKETLEKVTKNIREIYLQNF